MRRQGIAEQDGVHDALGQTAPGSDDDRDHADERAVEVAAASRHGGAHHVGGHVHRAEHQPARKEHEEWGRIARRIGEIESSAERDDRGEDGGWDAPVHHVTGHEIGAAEQDQHARGLAGRARNQAKRQILGGRGLLVKLPERERGRGGDCVHRRLGERQGQGRGWHRREATVVEARNPGGHRDRERGLEHRAPNQRGIEGVVAKPSKERLAHRDADHAPGRIHPERQRGRKDEAVKKAGDHRRPVADRAWLALRAADEVLGQHTGDRGHRDGQQSGHPEREDGKPDDRQKREHDVEHDRVDAVAAENMGRCANF